MTVEYEICQGKQNKDHTNMQDIANTGHNLYNKQYSTIKVY
jgi:hypothetical protein